MLVESCAEFQLTCRFPAVNLIPVAVVLEFVIDAFCTSILLLKFHGFAIEV